VTWRRDDRDSSQQDFLSRYQPQDDSQKAQIERLAREKLIRTGSITPFQAMAGLEKGFTRVKRERRSEEANEAGVSILPPSSLPPSMPSSSSPLASPQPASTHTPLSSFPSKLDETKTQPRKTNKRRKKGSEEEEEDDGSASGEDEDDEETEDDEHEDEEEEEEEEDENEVTVSTKKDGRKHIRRTRPQIDDADDQAFRKRLAAFKKKEEPPKPAKKQTKPTNTPPATNVTTNATTTTTKTKEWVCAVCTYINSSRFRACDMCRTKKPPASALPEPSPPPIVDPLASASATTAQVKLEEPEAPAIKREEDKTPTKKEEDKAEKEGGEEEDPENELVQFEGGYSIPGSLWDKLFPYQKTAVKWLWELHCQNTGGIIADEMGLGKTVQIVAFLAGLHSTPSIGRRYTTQQHRHTLRKTFSLHCFSSKGLGPTLIVCPATVMSQWMAHFHLWYPPLRVMLLHESGMSM